MTDVDLPQGWAMAQVGALGDFINGMAFKPTDWGETGTPIIRIQNLTDPDRPINLTEREVDEKYVVEHGDILVSWSATLDAFKWHGSRAYVNQHIFKVVPNSELDPGFVFYALKKSIKELISSEHLHGSTMKHINRRPFLAHPCALPPLNEQQRIVEKIETLFAELDKGEESLRQVQTLLARYRQSVLKAAVTGELTADWRAERAGKLEHGRELLNRMLQGRRIHWKGRGAYQEPSLPDVTGLPKLPAQWTWATAGQVCGFITKGTTPRKGMDVNGEKTIPFLRVTNLTSTGRLDFSDQVFISESVHQGFLSRSVVYPGDVLMNIVGPPLGQVSVVPSDYPEWNINQAIAIFRGLAGMSAGFISAYLLSPVAQAWLKARAKTTAGQTNLTLDVCRRLPVPVPPAKEQAEIAKMFAAVTDSISAQKAAMRFGLKQAEALRQSILKDAFSGRLVPQDPNDEPAAELLARVCRSQEAGRAAKR